uniref:Zinc finger RNA binding protein 2 n=1 Tax=Macaca nemestrina TaxID=9545 RepID=A0A2K6E1B6_MACNE
MAASHYFGFAQGSGLQYRPPPPALASGLPCALPWTGCSASDAVTALSPSLRDLRDLACICSILWDPAW